jgi:hypothetical protein
VEYDLDDAREVKWGDWHALAGKLEEIVVSLDGCELSIVRPQRCGLGLAAILGRALLAVCLRNDEERVSLGDRVVSCEEGPTLFEAGVVHTITPARDGQPASVGVKFVLKNQEPVLLGVSPDKLRVAGRPQ